MTRGRTLIAYLAAGAVLFALHAAVAAPAIDGPLRIGADTQAALASRFEREHGRAPTDAELEGLVQAFVDEELLVREALALGLDRGDPIVRRRLIQKLRFLHEDLAVIPDPDEAAQLDYLRAHLDRYARPDRTDLRHVFVAELSAEGEARARALLTRLERGEEAAQLGDAFPHGRRVVDRDEESLDELFGPGFAARLATAPEGEWTVTRSSLGWHVVRVEARRASATPSLAAVRNQLLADMRRELRSARAAEELERLRARAQVIVEPRAGGRS